MTPPRLTGKCKVCGERVQRNGLGAKWRHQRPDVANKGLPHDHKAQVGGRSQKPD